MRKPDTLSTTAHHPSEHLKTLVLAGMAGVLGILLIALTVYAMFQDDGALLGQIFQLIKTAVYLVLVWAGGGGIFRILSQLSVTHER